MPNCDKVAYQKSVCSPFLYSETKFDNIYFLINNFFIKSLYKNFEKIIFLKKLY